MTLKRKLFQKSIQLTVKASIKKGFYNVTKNMDVFAQCSSLHFATDSDEQTMKSQRRIFTTAI